MVDIHCHILPGVDDGADTPENALIMARMAAASGVDTIVATAHCNLPYGGEKNYFSPQFRKSFIDFVSAVKSAAIPVKILPGVEVFATPDLIEHLDNREIITLAGSRYLLVEFAFRENLRFIDSMLSQIAQYGLCPVIAHPERYHAVQKNPGAVGEWFERGYVIQLNKSSILGHFGRREKQTSEWILANGIAHVAASDAHGHERRTPHMSELMNRLELLCGTEYAQILLEDNPRRIVNDMELVSIH